MLQSPTLKTCLQPATKTVLVSKEANVSLYLKKKKQKTAQGLFSFAAAC